ncbi:hypothetical protein EZ449_10170 [Pedobacter frigidisoli]|uniref:Uncharacterized protein n=1 Tax=Pedobacter frigidisoli TaxID=2530455 RepID=A0A4R0P3G9_9SPHI|nr:hypothetical protein [Pedobacter frigidisoli]TCD10183.1 hypothetical protein EZ449_10170 [Pedobacter frigidisoli]
MEIKKIMDSGLMETFVMGIATEEEVEKVLLLKKQHPEFQDALEQLELDMEALALSMAVPPPIGALEKIENEINEIQLRNKSIQKAPEVDDRFDRAYQERTKQERYIEVESESNQMRINKAWKWVFAAVFILGKVFLATAIYFYLENRQAQEQIKDLKIELKLKTPIK